MKTGLLRVPRVDRTTPLIVAAVPAVRRRRQDAVVDVEDLQESFLIEQITAVLVVEDHRAHTSVVREPRFDPASISERATVVRHEELVGLVFGLDVHEAQRT